MDYTIVSNYAPSIYLPVSMPILTVLVNVALWESQDLISAPTFFFFRGFGDCVWSHLLNSGMKSAGFSQRLS